MNRERREEESYKKYKENLKKEDFLLRTYLGGRIFWDSGARGQYINPYRKNRLTKKDRRIANVKAKEKARKSI